MSGRLNHLPQELHLPVFIITFENANVCKIKIKNLSILSVHLFERITCVFNDTIWQYFKLHVREALQTGRQLYP